MNSIETLATFFGWCAVINIGARLLFMLALSLLHGHLTTRIAKMFGITREEAALTFFRLLLQYRLAIVILNIVPYLALKIMS